jgi:hypothetical protein
LSFSATDDEPAQAEGCASAATEAGEGLQGRAVIPA